MGGPMQPADTGGPVVKASKQHSDTLSRTSKKCLHGYRKPAWENLSTW